MKKILIFGSDDVATATAVRLFRSGFRPCLIDDFLGADLFSYRNFNLVPLLGAKTVDGVTALTSVGYMERYSTSVDISTLGFIRDAWANRIVPFVEMTDLSRSLINLMDYLIVCRPLPDKILEVYSRPPTLALGFDPSFSLAEYRVCAHGPCLGRVGYPFIEIGEPGKTSESPQVVKTESDGVFISFKTPGEHLNIGEALGTIGDERVVAKESGFVYGLLRSGAYVGCGQAIAQISRQQIPQLLPGKAYAVAGGFLEAIMYDQALNLI